MNAKEAREKAKAIILDAENSQYAEVKKVIASAVKKGNFSCYYYDSLKPEVKAKLESEEFSIYSHFDQREGATITISW